MKNRSLIFTYCKNNRHFGAYPNALLASVSSRCAYYFKQLESPTHLVHMAWSLPCKMTDSDGTSILSLKIIGDVLRIPLDWIAPESMAKAIQ